RARVCRDCTTWNAGGERTRGIREGLRCLRERRNHPLVRAARSTGRHLGGDGGGAVPLRHRLRNPFREIQGGRSGRPRLHEGERRVAHMLANHVVSAGLGAGLTTATWVAERQILYPSAPRRCSEV